MTNIRFDDETDNKGGGLFAGDEFELCVVGGTEVWRGGGAVSEARLALRAGCRV